MEAALARSLPQDDTFIKRYAARIPILRPGEPRQVFAPLLYPVLSVHDGNYDELFIETAIYDDGFAKTVHCHQAPHRDPLVEEADGSYPLMDSGIQLGWDDLQLLDWYIRQLAVDPSCGWFSPRGWITLVYSMGLSIYVRATGGSGGGAGRMGSP